MITEGGAEGEQPVGKPKKRNGKKKGKGANEVVGGASNRVEAEGSSEPSEIGRSIVNPFPTYSKFSAENFVNKEGLYYWKYSDWIELIKENTWEGELASMIWLNFFWKRH